ncbi:MAG: 50S ribosomal protein L24 [bacterium]|nr:50S ribosomal protein L24 [bacterium]
MKVVKNDTVLVVSGNSRGKKGKILKVFPKDERVIVEGVNFIKRHTRKSQKNPQGGIVEREAPIHASNVKLICSKCNKAARVGRVVLENKKRVRVCRSCGEMLSSS